MFDDFLNSPHVIRAPEASTRLLHLTFTYADWCHDNGHPRLSDRAIRKSLRQRGFEIKTIKGSAMILGLKESEETILARVVEKARIAAMYQ